MPQLDPRPELLHRQNHLPVSQKVPPQQQNHQPVSQKDLQQQQNHQHQALRLHPDQIQDHPLVRGVAAEDDN